MDLKLNLKLPACSLARRPRAAVRPVRPAGRAAARLGVFGFALPAWAASCSAPVGDDRGPRVEDIEVWTAGGSDRRTSLQVWDMAPTMDGGVVVVGDFDGTPTFDAGEAGSITLSSLGQGDAFVVRYAPEGFARWAARIGGHAEINPEAGDKTDSADSVASLSDGAIAVAGFYFDEATVSDVSPDSTSLTCPDHGTCSFVAVYEPDGRLRFAFDEHDGPLFVSDGPAPDPALFISGRSQGSGLLARLDPRTGREVWRRGVHRATVSVASSAPEGLLVAGPLEQEIVLETEGAEVSVAPGYAGGFVGLYDVDGRLAWVNPLPKGPVVDVAASGEGSVVLVDSSRLAGSVSVGNLPEPGCVPLGPDGGAGGAEICGAPCSYAVWYDAAGQPVRASPLSDCPVAITSDVRGMTLAAVTYCGGPGGGEADTNFLLRLDPEADLLAKHLLAEWNAGVASIRGDSHDAAWVAGIFSRTLRLFPDLPGGPSVAARGNLDLFVARIPFGPRE